MYQVPLHNLGSGNPCYRLCHTQEITFKGKQKGQELALEGCQDWNISSVHAHTVFYFILIVDLENIH